MVSLVAIFDHSMKSFVNTLNKCANKFYLTFGNFFVISLTKMTKSYKFKNRLPKKQNWFSALELKTGLPVCD